MEADFQSSGLSEWRPDSHGDRMDSADLALLQTPGGVRLLQFTDTGIQAHSTGLTSCDRYAWLGENGVVALTRRRGRESLWRQISILMLEGGRVRPYARIETPIPAADVTVLDGRIVIGGDSASESRLWWMHPDERCWRPLEMPADLQERKAVDGLATDGKVLVAIDNIVFPKWMVRYVPNESAWMRLERVAQMRSQGSYERVLSASSGDTYFAVLSATVGAFAIGRHLCTYRFDDLSAGESVERVSVPDDAPSPAWEYCMQRDTLWVLNKQLRAPKILRQPGGVAAGVHILDGGAGQMLRTRKGFLWVLSRESSTLSPLDSHSSDERSL